MLLIIETSEFNMKPCKIVVNQVCGVSLLAVGYFNFSINSDGSGKTPKIFFGHSQNNRTPIKIRTIDKIHT